MTDYDVMKRAGATPLDIWNVAGKRLSRRERIELVRFLFDLSFEQTRALVTLATHGQTLDEFLPRYLAKSRLEDLFGLYWSMQVIDLFRRRSNIVAELAQLRAREQNLASRLRTDGVDGEWIASCLTRSVLSDERSSACATEPFVTTVETNLLLASNGILDHTSSQSDLDALWSSLCETFDAMYRAIVLASKGTPSSTTDLFGE